MNKKSDFEYVSHELVETVKGVEVVGTFRDKHGLTSAIYNLSGKCVMWLDWGGVPAPKLPQEVIANLDQEAKTFKEKEHGKANDPV